MMIKEKQVTVGASYHATSSLLSQPFQGEVVVKLTNSAILAIKTCAKVDEPLVSELNHRVVVSYRGLMLRCNFLPY